MAESVNPLGLPVGINKAELEFDRRNKPELVETTEPSADDAILEEQRRVFALQIASELGPPSIVDLFVMADQIIDYLKDGKLTNTESNALDTGSNV